MNIFVNRENSGWIIDQIYDDYKRFSRHNIVSTVDVADVAWFLNPWGFFQNARKTKCPSFVSVHHIDESKIKEWKFEDINKYASGCIVPNIHTEKVLNNYVGVPIYRFPYWVLSKVMSAKTQGIIKKENGEILIGSFQKDSEGKSNKPKLSKGPDVLLDVLISLKKLYNIKIILTGYNRGYLIENFKKENMSYKYFERATDLNPIYDSVDWCFITSRVEGGPQSILEASYRKVKVLSTDVGMASEVLHPSCICKDVNDFLCKFENGLDVTEHNFKKVSEEYVPREVISKIDYFFDKCLNNEKSRFIANKTL